MTSQAPERPTFEAIQRWLVGPARQSCSPEQIVGGLSQRLVAAGIPLWRVRIGQRVANPLIGAWGVTWNRDSGVEFYTVPRTMMQTSSYFGSPFEHVIKTRTSFRARLENLSPQAHSTLVDLANTGSTDYLALPIEYGDGSVQAGALTTDRPGGFSDNEIRLIEGLAPGIGAALEPAAMRHSMSSLLEVYLGAGPAAQIAGGAFLRGSMTEIEAAVLLTDLRGFTSLSEELPPKDLLDQLGSYFDVIVDAVRAEGGDVLKFMGDGVLSIFPAEGGRQVACEKAVRSIRAALKQPLADGQRFVAVVHVGPVVYGNIGSPDRLDFTVVGPTVNYVSRLEGIAKQLGRVAVCSEEVAAVLPPEYVESLGTHDLKGFKERHAVFGLDVTGEAARRSASGPTAQRSDAVQL